MYLDWKKTMRLMQEGTLGRPWGGAYYLEVVVKARRVKAREKQWRPPPPPETRLPPGEGQNAPQAQKG